MTRRTGPPSPIPRWFAVPTSVGERLLNDPIEPRPIVPLAALSATHIAVADTTHRVVFATPLGDGACPTCRSGVSAVGVGALPKATCAVCCDDEALCTLEPCRCGTTCRACLAMHWRTRGDALCIA